MFIFNTSKPVCCSQLRKLWFIDFIITIMLESCLSLIKGILKLQCMFFCNRLGPVMCAREQAGKSARQLQSYIQFLWSLPGTILGLILLVHSHPSLSKAVTTFLQLVTTFPSGWKRSQRRRSMLPLSQMPCLRYMYMYAVYLYSMT